MRVIPGSIRHLSNKRDHKRARDDDAYLVVYATTGILQRDNRTVFRATGNGSFVVWYVASLCGVAKLTAAPIDQRRL